MDGHSNPFPIMELFPLHLDYMSDSWKHGRKDTNALGISLCHVPEQKKLLPICM